MHYLPVSKHHLHNIDWARLWVADLLMEGTRTCVTDRVSACVRVMYRERATSVGVPRESLCGMTSTMMFETGVYARNDGLWHVFSRMTQYDREAC